MITMNTSNGNKWQEDLKKYVIRKHLELTGEELPMDSIKEVNIDFDIDFSDLSVRDLGNMYSFCIMMENYEYAETVHAELIERGCKVEVNLDYTKKIGSIDIAQNVNKGIDEITIDMKILPTGLMVDFDKLI